MRRFKRSLPVWDKNASVPVPFVQVGIALALIIGGAQLFIHAVDDVARSFDVSPLAFSLLVAPIATELPEKFNSVLWVRRRKDTLALGNMTGAMVFQSSFPVTIGLLLTPWHLEAQALVAAIIALVAGGDAVAPGPVPGAAHGTAAPVTRDLLRGLRHVRHHDA